jgi:tetratricopeptide (TPR) repeat protein
LDGKGAEALQTLNRIDFPLSKVTALQNIAHHHLKNGNSAKAAEFLELSVEAAKEIEYQEEKIRAYLDISDHFVAADLKQRAIETIEEARVLTERIDGFHRDGFFARIALGFLRAGSVELADRTLDLVADKTQMASCMVGFTDAFWANNEKEEAVETLEEAYAILKSQRDSEIRDSRARLRLLGTVAVQFSKLEKPERAIEIAQENIDEMEQFSALSQIAQVCTLDGKDEIARQALNAINEDSTRMFALIGMSDAKNQIDKKEEAVEVLNEAAALCETVPQLASRSEAYNEFASRFRAYGDTQKARNFLDENLKNIAEIRDETTRSVMLAELSDLYNKFELDLTDVEKEILKNMVRKSEW